MNRMRVSPILGMVAAALLAPQAAGAFSVAYDQKVTSRGQVMTSRVLLKDDQFRIEMAATGMPTYIIKNRSGLYQYLPSQKVAMSMAGLAPGMDVVEHPDDYVGYLQQRNAKRLRTESVDGQPCDVYQFDDPVSRATTTAWVSQRLRFPLKLDVDGPEGRVTVELSNIMLGAGIQEAVFELPAGVDVVSMGQIMQGVSNLLQGGQQ